jgi:protein ImuB
LRGGGRSAPPPRRSGAPPPAFVWRGRRLTTQCAQGPERLAPEWWLDDPAWASGLRDYWQVETAEGPRLWLFHTPADPAGPAWYAHGVFA